MTSKLQRRCQSAGDGSGAEAGTAAEQGAGSSKMDEDPGEPRPEPDQEAGIPYDSKNEAEEEEEEEENMPSFEFRFETAKLLIELDDKTDTAIQACHMQLAFPSHSEPILARIGSRLLSAFQI